MGKTRTIVDDDFDLEPLEDKTEALPLRSKRTERAQKKQIKKTSKSKPASSNLFSLPYELIMDILSLLRPSDIFSFSRTCRPLHDFIMQKEPIIARNIIAYRYGCLEKCFRLPVLMVDVDPAVHQAMQSDERQELLNIHKKPYQHIQPPDPSLVCTCLTCMLRWSALCLIVDFAHWQDNLDKGEPIPMIQRGKHPEWNQQLISKNAATVRKALYSPLWHGRLLETHLNSTTRAIKRHSANKGDRRRRFRMERADMESETDEFLKRSGPPSLDFPFHRDNYYMLESYLPNRGWNADEQRWMYMPASQHDTDIQFVLRWAEAKGLHLRPKQK